MVRQRAVRSFRYVDYTPDQFRAHIEALWKPGMNWENYGLWHVDHRRPLATFKFVNPDGTENTEEMLAANALGNLQPLWEKENLAKGDKWESTA